ncbi:MAG: histidine kinase, partial [Eubacterium sp.]|nr:histidine kinase [Eubacterium sp.]
MKLLIVDDEVNTRKGIIGRLPLSEMGITEVCEADDGINGLKAVSAFEPDIILTDVRMPRMDGVEMVYKIREQLPGCQVIFMSGYSDKEYLKSAIELKALNYIEKPINMNELKGALQASISLCEEERNKKKLLKTSLSLISNELALQLISRTPDWLSIAGNINAAHLDIPQEGIFA